MKEERKIGYLLPINIEQYKGYVNQIKNNKSDISKIESVQRTSIDVGINPKESFERNSSYNPSKTKRKEKEERTPQAFIPEITGKGQYFDEKI